MFGNTLCRWHFSMCCCGDSDQLELWLLARTVDLTDEIRPYVMGDKRLNSDWQFYLFPLKLPDGKRSGNRTWPSFSPNFLCSLIFNPPKEGKSTFPSCLFTAMLPPAHSFFHPTEPLSLSLPSSSGEGKGKKGSRKNNSGGWVSSFYLLQITWKIQEYCC